MADTDQQGNQSQTADGHDDGYNYVRFDGSPAQGDFDAFMGGPHVGERAPDGTLTELDGGAMVRLSDVWQGSDLLLEFGSYT